jgi:putative DNA primase/helicase
VTDALDGEPISLHRTWLAKNGNGKAPIEPNRLLLKGHRYNGGVIRLWPDSAVTMGLVLGEGVETCLSAALEGLTPVWATMSARNLANFPVLPIEGLTILIDHDKPNPKTGKRAGIDAAKALSQRYVAAGFNPHRDIHVFEPDTEGEDANDVVRRRRGLDR